MISTKGKSLLFFLCIIICVNAYAQTSVRPYTQVFSQNLKGSTFIFGNTSMNILENDTVALRKMNETGRFVSGIAGNGTYGNDYENMQFAKIDLGGTAPVFNMGADGWKYVQPSNNTTYGTAWRTLDDPAGWTSGTSAFGYGTTVATSIPTGKPSTYFVKTVTLTSVSAYSQFNFVADFADGAIIYVNGVEVKRRRMGSGSVLYNTLASNNGLSSGNTFSVDASYFNTGKNVIAVEVHKENLTNSLVYFNMSMESVKYVPANSSSADLVLPAGTNTIKFARLYWGGRIDNSIVSGTADTLLKVKIRKGNSGPYSPAAAASVNLDQFAITSSEITYQAYVDITTFLQQGGAGTYTIADIPASPGNTGNGGKYAGWCIMVAYENTAMPYRSVRIYDGFSQVFNAGSSVSQNVTLTGLNVPNNPLTLGDATMSTMVWEGDANLGASSANPDGDYVKVNGIAVKNAVNPVDNFWNGTISRNGAFVTTKNPNYYNQMGIDIDEMNVGTGYGILPGASTVNVEFGTEADQYFPSIFAFSILMKDPLVTINKTVQDANGNGVLESAEVLTYTLTGTNLGPGNAYNTVIVDSLPANVTYVANSLQVNYAPGITTVPLAQTDANDATDFAFKAVNGTRNYVKFYIGTGAAYNRGGTVAVGAPYSLSFKVKAQTIPGSITNTAKISANSEAGELFTDESTALISPAGAPVSVTLFSFTAAYQSGKTNLYWITQNELNNNHFEVERSEDGVNFSKRGEVAGNGTTTSTHNYAFTDAVNTNSNIYYYRLKIVDIDGGFKYSKIIVIRLKGSLSTDFSVFPSPFKDNMKVSVKTETDAAASFRLISFDGKELLNRKVELQKGENIVVLKDLDNLANGSYILEVNTGNERLIKKVVKN